MLKLATSKSLERSRELFAIRVAPIAVLQQRMVMEEACTLTSAAPHCLLAQATSRRSESVYDLGPLSQSVDANTKTAIKFEESPFYKIREQIGMTRTCDRM